MILHSFVYEVMSKVCEYVRKIMCIFQKYFSDGCAVQYKNYKKFLKSLPTLYSGRMEWNFFATSHGKLAVSGGRRDNKAINCKS